MQYWGAAGQAEGTHEGPGGCEGVLGGSLHSQQSIGHLTPTHETLEAWDLPVPAPILLAFLPPCLRRGKYLVTVNLILSATARIRSRFWEPKVHGFRKGIPGGSPSMITEPGLLLIRL